MIPACVRLVMMARIAAKTRHLLGARNGLTTPCRLWTGAQSKGGKRPKSGPYGSVWIPGIGGVRVHVAVAWLSGLIPQPRVPEGFNLDHKCERTLCIAEDHLELIPKEVNQALRWQRPKQRRAA